MSANAWSITPELPAGDHTYKVYATETSGLGNPEGKSEELNFELDTEAPNVTLTQPARTKNTKPTFAGTATENGTEVVVHISKARRKSPKAGPR